MEKIGQGSYGVVYRAEDITAQREVAVKVVRAEAADTSDVVHEVNLLRECAGSPHIVRYLESFAHGSDLWIVMEYCVKLARPRTGSLPLAVCLG